MWWGRWDAGSAGRAARVGAPCDPLRVVVLVQQAPREESTEGAAQGELVLDGGDLELHLGVLEEGHALALGPAADDDLGDAEDEDRLQDVRHRQ